MPQETTKNPPQDKSRFRSQAKPSEKYQNSANPPTKAVNAVDDPDIRPPDSPVNTTQRDFFHTPKTKTKPQDHDKAR